MSKAFSVVKTHIFDLPDYIFKERILKNSYPKKDWRVCKKYESIVNDTIFEQYKNHIFLINDKKILCDMLIYRNNYISLEVSFNHFSWDFLGKFVVLERLEINSHVKFSLSDRFCRICCVEQELGIKYLSKKGVLHAQYIH